VVQRVEGIDELIPAEILKRRSYERTTLLEISKSLKSKAIILKEEQALAVAKREREGLVLWTDGSRKEDWWVGCAVVWNEEQWRKRRVHLGRQKEAFDADMYSMSEAGKNADEIGRKKEMRRATVITNSQATL
jgi:hypothetical protein